MDVYKEWEELKTRPMPCLAQKCFQKQSWGRHDPGPCAYTCCFCNFGYNTWNSLLWPWIELYIVGVDTGCRWLWFTTYLHNRQLLLWKIITEHNCPILDMCCNVVFIHLHCASTMTTVCVSKADNRKIEVKIRAVKMQAICRLKFCCKSSSTFRIEHS